jgi:hypothetical protein
MTKIATEKRGRANGKNENVGVAVCMIVEGKGGAGNVPIHARIAAMSARGRIVVPGEIVEKGGSYVQGCPSQRKCKKKSCTMYSPAFHMSIT